MTESERAVLDAAYRATGYRVDAPGGPIVLRVGETNPEMDRVLEESGCGRWVFVSAWNPRSAPLPPEENRARHEEMLAFIRSAGWPFLPGAGVGDDGLWPPEESVLVLGVSRDDARALASAFGQWAFVCGEREHPAELVWV